jgi:hypothetical protein
MLNDNNYVLLLMEKMEKKNRLHIFSVNKYYEIKK